MAIDILSTLAVTVAYGFHKDMTESECVAELVGLDSGLCRRRSEGSMPYLLMA